MRVAFDDVSPMSRPNPADPSTPPTRLVVRRADQHVIRAEDFGAAGLEAHESVGPFARVRALGPVITVHDSSLAAGRGIGHHPHQHNERFFYLLDGALRHDDALNRITADADAGDLAIFTEGKRGMIHAERNPAERDGRIWILVAATNPVPEKADVRVVKSRDAGRARPAEGVSVKELLGPRSPATAHADVRMLADVRIRDDACLRLEREPGEAMIVQPIRGRARVLGEPVGLDDVFLLAPDDDAKEMAITGDGEPTRALIAVTGPGYGLVLDDEVATAKPPVPRRRSSGER